MKLSEALVQYLRIDMLGVSIVEDDENKHKRRTIIEGMFVCVFLLIYFMKRKSRGKKERN